jgi:hypothetical protein
MPREKPILSKRQVEALIRELGGKPPRPPLGEPWLWEGVSRSTWYRRRRKKREEEPIAGGRFQTRGTPTARR